MELTLNLMVFAANTVPFFNILVLSMSFILKSDMQSDKNNNEVNDDSIALIGQNDKNAKAFSLASGSDLRGPEVKLGQRGHIAPAPDPRRPVTQDFSSSRVFVASQAYLGTNAGREVMGAASQGGIHSDASRSGEKEFSLGYDCASPAIYTHKSSPIENDSEYHSHPGEVNLPTVGKDIRSTTAAPSPTSGAQRGAKIQDQPQLAAFPQVSPCRGAKAKTPMLINLSSMMTAVSVVLTNFGTEQHRLMHVMLSFEHNSVHLQTLFAR